MTFKTIIKTRVARNAYWLIGGNVFQKALAFVVSIWTARYLGPGNYGLINYATAYTTFFFSLSTLGINSIIVKQIVDKKEEAGTTIGTTLVLQTVASVISIILILLIVFCIDYGETITLIVVFLCSLGLLFQVFDSVKYWYQANQQSKYPAMATTISYTLSSLYKVYLLINGYSVKWFALATSVDYICAAIILLILYFKSNGPKFEFSYKTASTLLKQSYHYILSGLMISIYGATDRLMLKQMLDESAVGYYGTAISLCNVWVFVLGSIIEAMNPEIMESYSIDYNKYLRENKMLYSLVFYISIIVSLMFCIFANPIILLLYGEKYLPASMPLRIITWYVAFSYLGVARNTWLVCEGKQLYLKYIYVGAAFVNVILNFALIPILGVNGAAIASLITQFSTIFVFPYCFKDLRPNVRLMIDSMFFR